MENGSSPDPVAHKARKQRSPSYPAIGLRDAIERARVLYNHEGRNPAPVSAALAHWGYTPKSSGGRLALAALKKYGLIDDEGSKEHRQVRLTRLALTIILDAREDSEERQQAIRKAALAPTIHQALLNKYPEGLPSDANLRHYLLLERAFTEGAVSDFIPRFRATIAFAGLDGGGTLSPDEEDKTTANGSGDLGQEPGVTPPPATNAAANQRGHRTDPPPSSPLSPPSTAHRAVQVPLSGAEWVTVQGAFPLTEEAWDQMIAVLNAMKPGLVKLGSD